MMSQDELASKKRWTTAEQATFLESKKDAFLKAQANKELALFWPSIDQDWFARWPEREIAYPAPPGEPAPPLSPAALTDLQKRISARKGVRIYYFTHYVNFTNMSKIANSCLVPLAY